MTDTVIDPAIAKARFNLNIKTLAVLGTATAVALAATFLLKKSDETETPAVETTSV